MADDDSTHNPAVLPVSLFPHTNTVWDCNPLNHAISSGMVMAMYGALEARGGAPSTKDMERWRKICRWICR